MRQVRYQVACSLDGYIAGPSGEFDWIPMDPEIDFEAVFARFDTLLMGRRTYELTGADFPGKEVYVFSRTLKASEHPRVTVVSESAEETVRELRAGEGKDIWLFGGGELFRSLLEAGLVDTVEVAVIPFLLGGGIPLLPSPASRTRLTLEDHRLYRSTGTMLLQYRVESGAPAGARKGRKRRAT